MHLNFTLQKREHTLSVELIHGQRRTLKQNFSRLQFNSIYGCSGLNDFSIKRPFVHFYALIMTNVLFFFAMDSDSSEAIRSWTWLPQFSHIYNLLWHTHTSVASLLELQLQLRGNQKDFNFQLHHRLSKFEVCSCEYKAYF